MGAHALDALLDVILPEADDTLVFLGDLVDQGPETREVLERVIELKSLCRVVLIEGNHEEMMFAVRRVRGRCDTGNGVAGL